MRILVFGAGSLGSLIGGLLARHHEVTLVGRDPHISTVQESGLRVTGERAADVEVDAVTEVSGESFDCTVVVVKAFDTPTAARALADCAGGTVVSLQNGMGNEAILDGVLDCPVLAGTCTYGARLVEPGVVECTGVGEVPLGAPDGGPSNEADAVAETFREGGLDAEAVSDMPTRLWEKLAVNAGINAVTALSRVPNGALVDGPAAETAREAARETARVGRASGVDLTDDAAARAVARVADVTAANTSSMRQDVESNSRTEIDAINGYVAEQADQPVPVNRTLAALVREWERERDLR